MLESTQAEESKRTDHEDGDQEEDPRLVLDDGHCFPQIGEGQDKLFPVHADRRQDNNADYQ